MISKSWWNTWWLSPSHSKFRVSPANTPYTPAMLSFGNNISIAQLLWCSLLTPFRSQMMRKPNAQLIRRKMQLNKPLRPWHSSILLSNFYHRIINRRTTTHEEVCEEEPVTKGLVPPGTGNFSVPNRPLRPLREISPGSVVIVRVLRPEGLKLEGVAGPYFVSSYRATRLALLVWCLLLYLLVSFSLLFKPPRRRI